MLVPFSIVFDVNTGIWKSSPPYVNILLLRLISTSISTSSHLCHVNMLFWLSDIFCFFFRPNNLSNSPPHQGTQIRLNCYWVCERKLGTVLLFITFLTYLATDTKVFTILFFIFRGLFSHAMNNFNDLINTLVAWFWSACKCTDLVRKTI